MFIGWLVIAALPAATALIGSATSLLNWDDHVDFYPNVIRALLLAGLGALAALWTVGAALLHHLGGVRGIPWSLFLSSLVLAVPVGYVWLAHSLGAWDLGSFAPLLVLAAFAIVFGLLTCTISVVFRNRWLAGGLAVACVPLALIVGVAVHVLPIRAQAHADFDRYAAVPVLRHSAWELVGVSLFPASGEMTVEYAHGDQGQLSWLMLRAYRSEGASPTGLEESCSDAVEPCQVIEHGDYTVVRSEPYAPELYMGLDAQTRVQLTASTGAQGDPDDVEVLIDLADHVERADGAERAELRDLAGRLDG
ncbi:hypothetical protein ACFWTE_11345 [Nocardiopsis sp. NPDC058631]|uniref:hypothetical protein n=1 Tax=Nocardiopsis sp. NPDC058631 TaxID=3346566 RepID=UPI0036523599